MNSGDGCLRHPLYLVDCWFNLVVEGYELEYEVSSFCRSTCVGIVLFGPWIEEYPFQQRWETAALELPDATPTSEGAFYCAEIVQTMPRQTGTPINGFWPVVFSESMPNDTIASTTTMKGKYSCIKLKTPVNGTRPVVFSESMLPNSLNVANPVPCSATHRCT
jgi:hypothetical protein